MRSVTAHTYGETSVLPGTQDTAARPEAAPASASGCTTADGQPVLWTGRTTASYFWDDGSGRNGDTGAPASGEPMQKGLAASPSWPMGTEGYVVYHGRKAEFFIGDRGPGIPSSDGVMLDLDGKTFAELTGGSWDDSSLTVEDVGGIGHIPVTYVITKWGSGPGKKGEPKPFSTGAYAVTGSRPPCPAPKAKEEQATAAATSAPPPLPAASPSAPAPQEAEVAAQTAETAQAQETAPVAASAELGSAGEQDHESGRTDATHAAATTETPAQTPVQTPGTASGQTSAETPRTLAKAEAKTPAQSRQETGTATASPALTSVSAVTAQPGEDAAAPAFAAAIIVCALAVIGAKAALRRPAHAGRGDDSGDTRAGGQPRR